MTEYAALVLPAANRVYAAHATRLLQAELEVLGRWALGSGIRDVRGAEIGGLPYLAFTADDLGDADLRTLANASSLYALFAREGELLRPLPMHRLDRHPSDLLTIQKYVGKTNEQFTKLLLNVTAALHGGLDRMTVFDPMCGRGTTLNQALMYGYDALGMEIDRKDVDSYATFLRTWLKNNRYKHQADLADIRRNRARIGRRFEASFAADKEDYKAGRCQRVEVVCADTTAAAEFFPENRAEVIVTDLPYGVQHGSSKPGERLARNPVDLVRAALPGWLRVLRPGGAIGMSWNTNVAPRAELAAVLSEAGLEMPDLPDFSHRVDQSIVRDLIVAVAP